MIAILTDFGTRDPYVGVMKGVIHGINPAAALVDLTHAVTRQAIREGAFLLANSAPYFPAGTVFLAVVDPGVGSARRPIAAEADGHWFVGPDNGLLASVLEAGGGWRAVELTAKAYRLPRVSHSFHGRDIFAPAAAHLSLGVPLEDLGPAVSDLVRLPPPKRERSGSILCGEVMHIDGFGNIETSLGPLIWQDRDTVALAPGRADGEAVTLRASALRVALPAREHPPLNGLRHAYSEANAGALLAMISSAGYLEISSNGASAAERIGARLGDAVELILE